MRRAKEVRTPLRLLHQKLGRTRSIVPKSSWSQYHQLADRASFWGPLQPLPDRASIKICSVLYVFSVISSFNCKDRGLSRRMVSRDTTGNNAIPTSVARVLNGKSIAPASYHFDGSLVNISG